MKQNVFRVIKETQMAVCPQRAQNPNSDTGGSVGDEWQGRLIYTDYIVPQKDQIWFYQCSRGLTSFPLHKRRMDA